MSKKFLLISVFFLLVCSVTYVFYKQKTIEPVMLEEVVEVAEIIPPPATSTVSTIGSSVEGRPILSYKFGSGSTTLLFVGGIHGGYEWNSSALAYEFINAFNGDQISVPDNLSVVIVPTLNPDGLFAATGLEGKFSVSDIPINNAHETGEGRFNANGVDLNRNFDCKWQPESTWRSKVVSAGTAPFSEPEALALKELVLSLNPETVVFWHSQANAVYGSECETGILPATLTLLEEYASGGTYSAVPSFDAYPVSGDAEGWLASIGIPAVTVELGTRNTTEWEKNRAAVARLLLVYGK